MKDKILSGIMLFEVKAALESMAKAQAKHRINSIGSSFESATSGLGNTLGSTINDIKLLKEKENPIIIDIPPKIESETIIDFPAIPKEEPQITGVPADSGVKIPNIEVFPTLEKSSMDDLILNIKKNRDNRPYLERGDELTAKVENNPNLSEDCSYEDICKEYEDEYTRAEIAIAYYKYTGKTDHLNNIDYVRIIEENGGSVEEGEHAHHIAYKLGRKGKMREYVEEAQEILRRYGIDPILDPHNLVSAPNKGHSIKNMKEVLDTLEKAEKIAKSQCEKLKLTGNEMNNYVKEQLYDALKELGKIASKR